VLPSNSTASTHTEGRNESDLPCGAGTRDTTDSAKGMASGDDTHGVSEAMWAVSSAAATVASSAAELQSRVEQPEHAAAQRGVSPAEGQSDGTGSEALESQVAELQRAAAEAQQSVLMAAARLTLRHEEAIEEGFRTREAETRENILVSAREEAAELIAAAELQAMERLADAAPEEMEAAERLGAADLARARNEAAELVARAEEVAGEEARALASAERERLRESRARDIMDDLMRPPERAESEGDCLSSLGGPSASVGLEDMTESEEDERLGGNIETERRRQLILKLSNNLAADVSLDALPMSERVFRASRIASWVEAHPAKPEQS